MSLLLAGVFGCDASSVLPERGRPLPPGTTSSHPAERLVELVGRTMGTVYRVKLAGRPPSHSTESIQEEIDRRLLAINQQMSTYDPNSELSRFNAQRDTAWFSVSPDTALVVAHAQQISEATGGAFDVTVMPLVNLWGFGPQGRRDTPPDDAKIEEIRQEIGFRKIEVRRSPPALRKSVPGVSVDLSAIAKGFGVDKIAEYLEEIGVQACLVEIGGEVRTRGRKPDGTPWRIGIERPVPGEREVQRPVPLNDRALASSGDYRNYFEKDGRRYSHEIDPRTGRPIDHALAAVSVLSSTCMDADGWSTALMVLGPDEAYNLAERRGLAAYFLIREGDRFVEKMTEPFQRVLESE